MKSRAHPTKRDGNHKLVSQIMRARMGGYWRDENGAHHANMDGIPIAAYDMHRAGSGFPDWIIFIHWIAVCAEIKNPDGRGLRFTPDEEQFMLHFPGLRWTIIDGDDLLDRIRSIVRFVQDVDQMMTAEARDAMPADYRSWFASFVPKFKFTGETVNETIEPIQSGTADDRIDAREPAGQPTGHPRNQ